MKKKVNLKPIISVTPTDQLFYPYGDVIGSFRSFNALMNIQGKIVKQYIIHSDKNGTNVFAICKDKKKVK